MIKFKNNEEVVVILPEKEALHSLYSQQNYFHRQFGLWGDSNWESTYDTFCRWNKKIVQVNIVDYAHKTYHVSYEKGQTTYVCHISFPEICFKRIQECSIEELLEI